MSSPVIYQIGKISDGDAHLLLSELVNETGFLITGGRLSEISLDKDNLERFARSKTTHAVSEMRLASGDNVFRIHFRRGVSGVSQSGSISVGDRLYSPYIDEIHVEISQKGQDTDSFNPLETLIKIERVLEKWSYVEDAARDEKRKDDATRAHLTDLRRLHKSFLSDIVLLRKNIDEELSQRKQAQSSEFKELKATLEKELSDEREKLASVQSALDVARENLDDRNHMHVRRELRKHISDEIASRVASDLVGRKSQTLNWAVTSISITCAIIAGSYSAWQFWEFSGLDLSSISPGILFGEYLPWALLIRGSVSASAAAIFLALTLMWLRRTYLDNVRITHDLQRYSLDINRASWVIETIMEMTNKEGRVLPDRWIEGVCFGLFRSTEADRSDPSPLEAWGTLLNLSGRAEIGPGGPKIEFTNSRQTRRAAKGSDD